MHLTILFLALLARELERPYFTEFKSMVVSAPPLPSPILLQVSNPFLGVRSKAALVQKNVPLKEILP
jgi:hypothetical protein